ncbi:hypothetical protein [Atopococcus tabaci]|uniref:hypothetical protein n=1 Tax=Atopococcus tabaci TaxID=269774 RepID=UPI00240A93FD|nr:hypothetical protein [Atopococcus tabaci]
MIDFTTVITALISAAVGIVATLGSRKTSKEEIGHKMLERAQEEIVRLDSDKLRLEKRVRLLEGELDEKEDKLRHNEFERKKLIDQLDAALRELEETKTKANKLKEKIAALEALTEGEN